MLVSFFALSILAFFLTLTYSRSQTPIPQTVLVAVPYGEPAPVIWTGDSSFRNFYQSSEPILSPDGRYVWDPNNHQWIRRYTAGDSMMYLIVGFLVAGAFFVLVGACS